MYRLCRDCLRRFLQRSIFEELEILDYLAPIAIIQHLIERSRSLFNVDLANLGRANVKPSNYSGLVTQESLRLLQR